MIKRIFGELPDWAKQENPLLRYELVRRQGKSDSAIGRIILWVIVLAALVLGGYVYATNGLQRGLQLPYTLDIWRIVVFPLLFVQVILRVVGLSLGVGAVSDERLRQTWDNLRATENGADIGLRTRWVSVFYRLKGLIFTVMFGRIILVAAILYELTSMQGGYLDLLTARAIPMVSVEIGVILLAAFMTAFIMMPITATGVDIAIGLLISTSVRNRAVSTILQILVVTFRVVSAGILFFLSWHFINGDMSFDGLSGLFVLGGGAVFSDWGLILSQLSNAGQLWSQVPYAVFIGLFMLIMVVVQVATASGLLMLAVRTAELRE